MQRLGVKPPIVRQSAPEEPHSASVLPGHVLPATRPRMVSQLVLVSSMLQYFSSGEPETLVRWNEGVKPYGWLQPVARRFMQ